MTDSIAHTSWFVVPVLLSLVVAACVIQDTARGEDSGWQPQNTWVVVVGVLEWKSGFSGFPKVNRRDAELVKFFRDRQVPDSQVVFLEDKQATRDNIIKALADTLPKAKANDLLILYYAGHGTRDGECTYFANYDASKDLTKTGWSVKSMFDAIDEHFRGSHVILAADCCHSGILGVEAQKRKGRIAYSALTSVHPNGTSTGNWTFTDCLLKGLRGDGGIDRDGDGKVTLDELAAYVETEMAFVEGQMSSFTVTNGFDPRWVVAKAVAKARAETGPRMEVEWKGSWWPAQVMQVSDGKSHIHYSGFGPEWDEWVGPERIRPYKPQQLAVGTSVQVEWNEQWWPAKVIEARAGLHLIHYDGFGPEWDEWVGARRLRESQ